MRLIDTHCHLDVAAFDADREAVLANSRAAGVSGIVVPGIDAAGWPGLLALCADDPGLHPALGLHPLFTDRHRHTDLAALERALAEHTPVAVGEIGLDRAVADGDPARQARLFDAQLAIARAARLPVLLHVRKAHDEVITALRRTRVTGGIVHAFNGSVQQAARYTELGFRFGFGGMLTFERSRRLRSLAAQLPREALVLETDAPDMTVASHRGARNSPEYLPEVLTALAEVCDADPTELALVTTRNAKEILQLAL